MNITNTSTQNLTAELSDLSSHFYLIIGSGRLAVHLRHYVQLLGLPYAVWSRSDYKQNQCLPLPELLNESTHVLWAISDSALETEILKARDLNPERQHIHIHFSGALTTPYAWSAHPLMSFPKEGLWDLERYRRIPFIIEEKGPDFNMLLPGFPNLSYKIKSELKPLYHAYCVIAGNLSALLWQSVIHRFEKNLNLEREVLFPYLDQITENLKISAETAVTGPLMRQDLMTIQKNKAALSGDTLQEVYDFFESWLDKNRSTQI